MTCKFCNWVGRRDVSKLTNQRAPLFSLVRIEVKVGYMPLGRGYSNGGALGPSTSDSTYLLREGSGRSQLLLLGLRSQYSSYCSGCHSDFPDARQGGVIQFESPRPELYPYVFFSM
ncbi:hypothetical protein AVEN_132470-1 [Araneus ventricosus]|uniref:Uncharacterized protein n=1 Tax=Araneus ventricosus TaxID=182803 RepID=A0A4Y2PKG0_ARAVE|nr:hypothetical protein AVEN_132470-1 [Araneus ventricosus]